MKYKELDTRAKAIAHRYKTCEKQLLEIIILLDKNKAFRYWGFDSLFSYVTQALGLSPAVAYNFIGVARKSHEVPELKSQVLSGKLSIHQARKITSVVNPTNQKIWIERAQTQTQRQLEREVALANPKEAVREELKYISAGREIKEKVIVMESIPRVQLKLGVSEKIMLQLKRAQDLESQRLKKNISLEDTLSAVLDCYLQKNDPVVKAKRQKMRGKLAEDCEGESIEKTTNTKTPPNSSQDKLVTENYRKSVDVVLGAASTEPEKRQKREPIPAKVRHQVQLRDGGRCTHMSSRGHRCFSRRYLEIHHKIEVANGGGNCLQNLTTLCAGHHKAHHLRRLSPSIVAEEKHP